MKIWAWLALTVIITAALGTAVHFLVDAGKTSCESAHTTAALAATTHELAVAATVATADASNAGHLAAQHTEITSTTDTLRGAIDEPEHKTAAPGAVTRIPNPFPAGFSLCWNAASTGDPAAVAACQARRGDGLKVSGDRGEYGYGPAAVHAAGRPVPGGAGSHHRDAHPVPGGASRGRDGAARLPGGQGQPGGLDHHAAAVSGG